MVVAPWKIIATSAKCYVLIMMIIMIITFIGIVDGLIERIHDRLTLSSGHSLLHHRPLLVHFQPFLGQNICAICDFKKLDSLHSDSTVLHKFLPGILCHLWQQLLENKEQRTTTTKNKQQRSKQRTKGDQGTKVKEPVASVVGERGTSPSRYPAHSNRLPWGSKC